MEKQIGAWRDKNDIVFISHGDSLEDAQFVAELIKKRLGIENFLINHIGPTIGAHSGPGTIDCSTWVITAKTLYQFCLK